MPPREFLFCPQREEAKRHDVTRDDLIACLYVKGFGKAETLSEALGAPAEAVEAALAELVASGEAEQSRVGARLSASGKATAEPGSRASAQAPTIGGSRTNTSDSRRSTRSSRRW